MNNIIVTPHSLEVEQTILGSMLLDNDFATSAMSMLTVDDFYTPFNKAIYESMVSMVESNNLLDPITLVTELRKIGKLDVCGGENYVYSLTSLHAYTSNVDYYVAILKEKTIKRKLIDSCQEIIRRSYDEYSDSYDVLDKAERDILEISINAQSKQERTISLIVKESLSDIEALRNQGGGYTGIPTLFKEFDNYTAGLQNGEMVIIGARPSMGKTAFALALARNMALQGNAVGFFSIEMSDKSLVNRLITADAMVNSQNIRTAKLDSKDMFRLIASAGRVQHLPIFIDDRSPLSIGALRSKARRMLKDFNIKALFVDYLGLMDVDGFRGDIFQKTGLISKGLKSLAKELNIPVIVLSQLSRNNDQRAGDKRPQLSDLRNSGEIEQDADTVVFLHRPEYYGQMTTEDGSSTAGLTEVIIAKQRQGAVGKFNLLFAKEFSRFENIN